MVGDGGFGGGFGGGFVSVGFSVGFGGIESGVLLMLTPTCLDFLNPSSCFILALARDLVGSSSHLRAEPINNERASLDACSETSISSTTDHYKLQSLARTNTLTLHLKIGVVSRILTVLMIWAKLPGVV